MEGQATEILESKLGLKKELESLQRKVVDEKPTVVVEDNTQELAKVQIFFNAESCYVSIMSFIYF